jgi:hypothetical protein
MKVIEFIKRNISFFSVVALCVFLFFIKLIIYTDLNSCKGAVIFIFLLISFSFLIFDFILKKLIKNRLYINFLQLFILVLICIYYLISYN